MAVGSMVVFGSGVTVSAAEVNSAVPTVIGDVDTDGFTDEQEVIYGTDPVDSDSDDDMIIDGDEVANGTNPLKADTDGDGLSDYSEAIYNYSDPVLADTDNDGLLDGEETDLGSEPRNADTDGDGIYDSYDQNPTTPDATDSADSEYGVSGDVIDNGDDYLNNELPEVELPVDPGYGADADNSVNNDLPENENPIIPADPNYGIE